MTLVICDILVLFQQKTACEMSMSDWSSDVCSSDLGQAVLERAEQPLRPAPRLRRVGGDVADAELPERPADLRRMVPIDLAAGSCRVEVVAASVGVEAGEQRLGRNPRVARPERAGGPFLLHQQRPIQRTKGGEGK